jgi:hypothetical protein
MARATVAGAAKLLGEGSLAQVTLGKVQRKQSTQLSGHCSGIDAVLQVVDVRQEQSVSCAKVV